MKQKTAVLVMALSGAFLLGGYEFIRSASYTLFKQAYSSEDLATAMTFMPLAVLIAVAVYGKLLTWLGARRTLIATCLFSSLTIFSCYLALRFGFRPAAAVLFIFKDTYIVLVLEQLWSFLNSSIDSKTGKKFNGPVNGVISIGAIAAGFSVGQLATQLGTSALLVIAAASLIPTLLIANHGYRRCGEPRPKIKTEEKTAPENGGDTGLGLFFSSPHLRFILLLVIASQVLGTANTLKFQDLLSDTIHDPDQQTAFQGTFFAITNLFSSSLQFLIAPILLRRVSLSVIHVVIPAIHVAASMIGSAHPTLMTASASLLLFKSIDYSVFRAAKELLYIPLSFDSRYRAKSLIDVFGYRFSKGATSLLIATMTKGGAAPGSVYSGFAALAALVWMFSGARVSAHYRGTYAELKSASSSPGN